MTELFPKQNAVKKVVVALGLLAGVLGLVSWSFPQSFTFIKRTPIVHEARRDELRHPSLKAPPAIILKNLAKQVAEKKGLDEPIKVKDAHVHAARILVAKKTFERMFEVREHFNKEVLRDELLKELVSDPKYVEIMQETLKDPVQAKEFFGEKQALARVYSISGLALAAQLGNEKPLFDTSKHLMHSLNLQLAAHAPENKGVTADARDLLEAYVQTQPVKHLVANASQILSDLGYNPQLHPDLIGIFDDALFFRLRSEWDRAHASDFTQKALLASNEGKKP